MIYVDEPFVAESREAQAFRAGRRHGHRWSHMWCDAGEEDALHALAAKIGMRRAWFQAKPGFPHYDLVPTKRAAAVALGAKEVSLTDWLRERRKKQMHSKPEGRRDDFCVHSN